jgi:hypothetical protein
VLARRLEIDFAATPATALVVRRLFGDAGPAKLGVTARSCANIHSLVGRAVEAFGMRRAALTRATTLRADWAALLERARPSARGRGVTRLAYYCSALGVAPEAICSDTLLGLHDALEAESITKDPREVVRRIICAWNALGRASPG